MRSKTRKSKQKGGEDYSGKDLTGEDFSGQDLARSNFSNSTLSQTKFMLYVILCFLLFRFFDIKKPSLIGVCDRKFKNSFYRTHHFCSFKVTSKCLYGIKKHNIFC